MDVPNNITELFCDNMISLICNKSSDAKDVYNSRSLRKSAQLTFNRYLNEGDSWSEFDLQQLKFKFFQVFFML